MFNILSGLQEGSHSVTIVQRSAATGETFVKGQAVFTDGSGKLTKSFGGDASMTGASVEWIFEDIANQASTKYTSIFGSFEAETDQVVATAPVAGEYMKVDQTVGKMTKATLAADAALVVARCIKVTAASVDSATGTAIGAIYQFRTV
jgi:hypothetical protein